MPELPAPGQPGARAGPADSPEESAFDIYGQGEETLSEEGYLRSIRRKRRALALTAAAVFAAAFATLLWNNDDRSASEVARGFLSFSDDTLMGRYVWNIDMKVIVAALAVGAGLSLAGTVMQCVLKNPLASPYTLGISGAATFGAAASIVYFDAGAAFGGEFMQTYCTPILAFASSMAATGTILLLTRYTRIPSEAMVLAGIAVSAVFTAGMTLMQYMADSAQLSQIVSWSFGTINYATWEWDIILAAAVFLAGLFFMTQRWNMNAMEAGDEAARGLGVRTGLFLAVGMTVSSLLTALLLSKFGTIAFVGLLGPHIARMLIGNDHRYLIPMSMLFGMLLMAVSSAVALNIVKPHVLPVGLITSLLGGPAFIYLMIRRYRR